MKNLIFPVLCLSVLGATAADFINGPIVRKAVVNDKAVEGRAEWRVTGLGVFTCYVNGREVGAADVLKPGFTDVHKRRIVYTYDITDFLNKEAGATNVFAAITSGGWWSDMIVVSKSHPQTKDAFWCDGFVATDTSWEQSTVNPLNAGIYEGERWNDAYAFDGLKFTDPEVEKDSWTQASVNTAFKGELTPYVGAKTGCREPLKVVASWKVGKKTVYDFGQNAAAVPRFVLRGKPGATFRYRLGEILNDGVKDHHGDGEKDTIYTANLRGAAKNLTFTFASHSALSTNHCALSTIHYMPKYTFYGYRYLETEENPDVEIVSVESVPVTSVTEEFDRGTLEVGDQSLDRLVKNALWGMRSNYLSVPTDCPQRDERYGWTGDTQVFCETGLYFADMKDFFRKWMQDMCDTQTEDGSLPFVAPSGRWWLSHGKAAWADAGVVVPYRVWKATGDRAIIDENHDLLLRFIGWLEKTGYEAKKGEWLTADWLSFEKLTVDQRNRWSNGSYNEDHLSYQNFLNAVYGVADCVMLGEMLTDAAEKSRIAVLERNFRDKIAATWLKPDGSLVELFDDMQTPRLMALKIGAGDTARHCRELVEIIRKNGNRLSTGFVGTSELTEQLSRFGEHEVVWDVLMNHSFPGWLYSVDQGATTVWERWNGYTRDKGFGDVGMNSYNHYAYGSVVGWLFKYAAGIQPGKEGGYSSFTLAPHPDKRAGSLEARYRVKEGTIVSKWWYKGDKLCWHYEIPQGTTAEIVPPAGAVIVK